MNSPPQPKYLLVSDLDDTLLGEPKALDRFRAFCDGNPNLLGIVYASGRFCHSIQESIESTALPQPLATIGGVGSEIWLYPEQWPLQDWWDLISGGWSAKKVRQVLAEEPTLRLQPEATQSPFKVSYQLRDATQADLDRLLNRLAEAGLQASLVYSSHRDLDVLPHNVNKGTAAGYLIGRMGCQPTAVFGAGNSRNDAQLMTNGFSGIIVGNADHELKALSSSHRVYAARKTHADGVLEGIRHWMALCEN